MAPDDGAAATCISLQLEREQDRIRSLSRHRQINNNMYAKSSAVSASSARGAALTQEQDKRDHPARSDGHKHFKLIDRRLIRRFATSTTARARSPHETSTGRRKLPPRRRRPSRRRQRRQRQSSNCGFMRASDAQLTPKIEVTQINAALCEHDKLTVVNRSFASRVPRHSASNPTARQRRANRFHQYRPDRCYRPTDLRHPA